MELYLMCMLAVKDLCSCSFFAQGIACVEFIVASASLRNCCSSILDILFC